MSSLQCVPGGPALEGPEQRGATHLKPSRMSTGTFDDFLLGLEARPSWWTEQTETVSTETAKRANSEVKQTNESGFLLGLKKYTFELIN